MELVHWQGLDGAPAHNSITLSLVEVEPLPLEQGHEAVHHNIIVNHPRA